MNPPHYVIYDLILFRALFELDKSAEIERILQERRQILKNAYRFEYFMEGNRPQFLYSLIGPPHPYWIDVLRTFKD